jgi:hypothetical protein
MSAIPFRSSDNLTNAQKIIFCRPPKNHQKAYTSFISHEIVLLFGMSPSHPNMKTFWSLFSIYAPSGQNSQFGRLTKKPISPYMQILKFNIQMNKKA